MSRFDQLTSELCWEIDDLKDQLRLMTEERDEFRLKYNNLLDGTLKDAQRATGAMLMLAAKGCLRGPQEINK